MGVILTSVISLTVGILTNFFVSYRLGREIRLTLAKAGNFKPKQRPSLTPIEIRASFLEKLIEIERKLRRLARVDRPMSARQLASDLLKTGKVPTSLVHAIESVWKVRNAVIHGVDVPNGDIVRADEVAEYVLIQLSRLQG